VERLLQPGAEKERRGSKVQHFLSGLQTLAGRLGIAGLQSDPLTAYASDIGRSATDIGEAEANPDDPAMPAILVTDDIASQRLLVSAYLAKAGYRIVTASSGSAAASRAGKGDIDLVLMDVRMPGLDGLAATRLIRALPPPAGLVPIIALTAETAEADRKRCLATGMTGFLAKPVDRNTLLQAVETALLDRRPGCDVA
jgi:CheY-like chemotaxis protein